VARREEVAMNLAQAVDVLERLRDGKGSRDGRPALPECACQSADAVRALYAVLAALPPVEATTPAAEQPTPPRARPARAGAAWTDDEDERLGAAFDEGRGVAELARVFGRSRAAIRLRLVKLGRLSTDEAAARGRAPVAAAG
jgi:hypothetical protein